MGAEGFITGLTEQIPGGRWGALFFMMLVLFVVMMEISYMTPPFGFNLFYLRSVTQADPSMRHLTMKDIYWSVGPYTIVELTGLFIIVLFPAIALWLPGVLFSGN